VGGGYNLDLGVGLAGVARSHIVRAPAQTSSATHTLGHTQAQD